jgi:hypothetical protein
MVSHANFNNIAVICWRSVLLVEGTGVDGKNHRLTACQRQTLSHNAVSSTSFLSGMCTHNFSGDMH